jgi:glycine dehydrogenase subunit 1
VIAGPGPPDLTTRHTVSEPVTTYTSATDRDRARMLAEIGVGSIEDLFESIPSAVRLGRPLDLPSGLSEAEVYAHLRELAERNVSAEEEVTFVGAGMYDHYVPALVDSIVERSEFLTPYTPYQPEVSQGTLQAMFEYQTAISELTGLPVSNASVYEGPSATSRAWPTDASASSSPGACIPTAARPWRRCPRATGPR